MRPDLSALDAQLDALNPPAGFDVLALAEGYAGKLGPLPSIDDALQALEVGVPIVSSPSMAAVSEPAHDTQPVAEPNGTSVSIAAVAPPPLEFEADSEPPIGARHDVEPLAGGNHFETRESGAFSVSTPYVPPREESRDITMDAVDEELLETELGSMRPEGTPLANNALFDLNAPANVEAEQEADAAFAALFAEATRQSSMPSVSEPEPADDTEVFHTGELALDAHALQEGVPYPAQDNEEEIELEPNFHDETLDSAEFEIVNDVVTDGRPANSPSGRPSRPPEKRPSFLGRIFGRKDE
jgi:hypothetical protein